MTMTILFICCVFLVVTLSSALPDGVFKWSQLEEAKTDSEDVFDGFNIDVEQEWFSFKEIYGRVFNTPEDESKRKLIFENNLNTITKHNYLASRGLSSYTMAVNEFSDMTFEEFKSQMYGYLRFDISNNTGSTYLEPLNEGVNLPSEVDYRLKGCVTPVKNQGQCGSCWAFSTTGSVEGQQCRKTGKLVSLSEQNLVDCSDKFGNKACDGGNINAAFKYIMSNGGIDTEASYPYVAKKQSCKFKKSNIGAKVTGFVKLPSGNEKKLEQAVAKVGPISVSIDANHDSFQHYSKGVYDEKKCSNKKLDHSVLVVGYGIEAKKKYWLVKNSWGTKWGEKGYIKMSRNKKNQCGISTAASYPLV